MFLVTIVIVLMVLLIIGSYYLFRDTMNRIQYLERIRLYWITRDLDRGGPHIKKAWMRQVEAPYWRGHGIEFRSGKYTFQVGRLTSRGNSLQDQISSLSDYSPKVREIKKWGRGEDQRPPQSA